MRREYVTSFIAALIVLFWLTACGASTPPGQARYPPPRNTDPPPPPCD